MPLFFELGVLMTMIGCFGSLSAITKHQWYQFSINEMIPEDLDETGKTRRTPDLLATNKNSSMSNEFYKKQRVSSMIFNEITDLPLMQYLP